MFWFKLWLFLHILAAILAFGPALTFGLITGLAQRDPKHAPFATLVVVTLSERVTLPLAGSLAVSGIGLIVTGRIDLFGTAWLVVAVILWAIALAFSILVQRRNAVRMLQVLRSMPGPPAEGQGPPPEIPALGKKLAIGGAFLSLLTIAILVLMVWQPGGTQFR